MRQAQPSSPYLALHRPAERLLCFLRLAARSCAIAAHATLEWHASLVRQRAGERRFRQTNGDRLEKLLRPDQSCANFRPRGQKAWRSLARHIISRGRRPRRGAVTVAVVEIERKMNPLFWFMWLNATVAFTASALLSYSPLRRPRRRPVLRVIEGGPGRTVPPAKSEPHLGHPSGAVNVAQTFERPRPVESPTSYRRSRQHSPTSRTGR